MEWILLEWHEQHLKGIKIGALSDKSLDMIWYDKNKYGDSTC